MKKFTDKINESLEDKIPTAISFFETWCEEKGYVSIDECDDIEDCMIEIKLIN